MKTRLALHASDSWSISLRSSLLQPRTREHHGLPTRPASTTSSGSWLARLLRPAQLFERIEAILRESQLDKRGKRGDSEYRHYSESNTLYDAELSQADSAIWQQRVTGRCTGHYDAAGQSVSFTGFELKTNDRFSVAGEYTYTGSTGHEVEGSLDGRLIFNVDAGSKALTPVVAFDWTEPSGTGKGLWSVSARGRAAVETGGGGWELRKIP
jgi:hypothetical protein